MALLSPHFSEAEFERSQTATRRGIRNRMGRRQREAAAALCENVLEPLRYVLGAAISISSGYRSPSLNRAIGGSSSSQHCHGQAADIGTNRLSDPELFDLIRLLELPRDQLIEEFGAWVHVSYGPRNRRQDLLARRRSGRTAYLAAKPPRMTERMVAVVKEFQEEVELQPDGVIGPNTRAAALRWRLALPPA